MAASFELCYITDRQALAPREVRAWVAEAAGAGVDLIQIREKDLPTRELLDLVSAGLASIAAQKATTRLVVNDRLDVAWAAGAAGVHLGTRSLPPGTVRRIVLKDFLVGVSCHSLAEAREAQEGGADYIVLGPIFDTPSKRPYGPPLGLEKLREVSAALNIPVLALGGITMAQVKPCLQSGAAGIAGISIFQDCDSVQDRVRELRALVEHAPG